MNQNPESVSQFQKFTTETVSRSQLKGATYNPRTISDDAKRRLKQVLEKVGLVQPIVWNKRTGNIVGGHQRIKALDALEGSTEYRLTVAAVDVDDVRERELNVALNATQIEGQFDLEKLQEVLDFEGFELEAAGFDMADAMKLFGEAPSQGDAEDGHRQMLETMQKVKDAYDSLTKAHSFVDDDRFYNVVVYRSREDRAETAKALGWDDDRYIDGRTLAGLVGSLRARVKELELALTGAESNGANVG